MANLSDRQARAALVACITAVEALVQAWASGELPAPFISGTAADARLRFAPSYVDGKIVDGGVPYTVEAVISTLGASGQSNYIRCALLLLEFFEKNPDQRTRTIERVSAGWYGFRCAPLLRELQEEEKD